MAGARRRDAPTGWPVGLQKKPVLDPFGYRTPHAPRAPHVDPSRGTSVNWHLPGSPRNPPAMQAGVVQKHLGACQGSTEAHQGSSEARHQARHRRAQWHVQRTVSPLIR